MATTHCIRCKAVIQREFKACPHCGEPVTDFLRRYADEPVDGKYQILERLGAGGMGEVYKVTHTFLGATRVIKVIRPQISESQDAHDRFLREARAATKVQHPNVATLHDFSELPDGSHYMVWEYIEGENLAQRIRARGTLSPRYAVGLIIQALQGLEAIHRAGIVHRDISPENLMITREPGGEERVKIIDMGVAKVEGSTDSATLAGVFVGKLRYASPEHLGFLAEGERIDGRADLYSMAMVLYEMLTGRPPFEATSPHEYVMLHSRDTQFKPLNLPPDLPGGAQLQAILARALERDRNKRFASAREFANALQEVERSLPDPSMDRTLAVTPLPQPIDTLHRSTIRTGVGDAGPTIRTPMPGPIVAREEKSSAGALIVVAVIVIIAVGAITFVLLPHFGAKEDTQGNKPAIVQTHTTTSGTTATSGTDVDVVPIPLKPTTESSGKPPLIAEASRPPIATATAPTIRMSTSPPPPVTSAVTAPAAQPTLVQPTMTTVVHKRPPVEKPRETEPRPVEPAPAPVRAYVEGGDSSSNDELIENAKKHLHGTTRLTIHANGEMLKELTDRLKKEVPGVTITEGADTVIDFDGALERLGRGKKRRSAHATVSKNGRVIFRYEMPAEEYRVGDTPAEAFARLLIDALR